MNNKEKQPKGVQGTAVANVEKNPQTVTILKKVEPTTEDLQAENERLRKLLDREPKNLDEKIIYFRQKEQHIKNLTKLTGKRDYFLSVLDAVSGEVEEDEFMTDNFCIAIIQKKGYSDENVFKAQNPVLVAELLRFVLDKMQNKIEELEISISA